MNRLIEQLELQRIRLKLNDAQFAKHLHISRQLWDAVKSGEIIKSHKVENAAWEMFRICPDNQQDGKTTPLVSRIVEYIKSIFYRARI